MMSRVLSPVPGESLRPGSCDSTVYGAVPSAHVPEHTLLFSGLQTLLLTDDLQIDIYKYIHIYI